MINFLCEIVPTKEIQKHLSSTKYVLARNLHKYKKCETQLGDPILKA